MPKETGIGMTVAVDDDGGTPRLIGNDITSIQFATPQGLQDITGLDKSAIERIVLLSDGSVAITGVFNAAANKSHDVFKNVATTSVARVVTIVHSLQTLAMTMLPTDYVVNRANDGSLVWTANLQLSSGTVPVWS